MEIPKEIRKPKRLSPNVLLLYSTPKAGKTVVCSLLKDHLILELEAGGADYITGRIMEINKPSEFTKTIELLKNSPDKVCKYLVIDTTTKMDEWSEIVGTYLYMEKAQGKKFNKETTADGVLVPNGKTFKHTDKEFETVHSIGQGYGYAHSRQIMTDWYDSLIELITLKKIDNLILISHIKDKYIEKKGEIVESSDINLTGKVKSIYAARVDAIGFLQRKEGKAYLNFNNEYKVICGGRCHHLNGELLVSEKMEDGTIKGYWENIYID